MDLETKIRIVALLVAGFLFIGGCKAARHPKLTLVIPKPGVAHVQKSQRSGGQPPSPETYAHFVTSQTSRYVGIVRMIAGLGLAVYVTMPWWKNRARVVAPSSVSESSELQEVETKPKG